MICLPNGRICSSVFGGLLHSLVRYASVKSICPNCLRLENLSAGGRLCVYLRSRVDVFLAPECGLTVQIPVASPSSIQSNLKYSVYCRYSAAAATHPIRNFRKAHFAFA